MNRTTAKSSFLLLLTLQTACASSSTDVDALWQKEVRSRAVACFNHHSEQHYLTGSGPVWAARQRWATSQHAQTLGEIAAP
tara:strand:- start:1994 stop:2236 length:243 start_codon:yes stop_codon:yes gene_type:complete